MTLILVRHGRSDRNREGRLSGRDDVDLDDVGRTQARQAGAALAGLAVSRVVTSPLRRARGTAELLGLDASIEVDDAWIELDYGEWEGLALSDVDTEAWARWRTDLDFAPPGGESIRSVGERVRLACEALRDDAAASPVVVVSHVSPIKAAMAWALGVDDGVAWRSQLATAAISRISVSGRGVALASWNEVGHLADP